MPYFSAEKLHFRGSVGEFLPRNHAHPASEFRAHHRRHNFETILDQILTALVAERQQRMPHGRGPPGRRESIGTSDIFLVPWAIDPHRRLTPDRDSDAPGRTLRVWKSPSVNLASTSRLSQLQIHLTSILGAVLQRDPRPEAKLRMEPRLDSEKGTDRRRGAGFPGNKRCSSAARPSCSRIRARAVCDRLFWE